VSETQQADQPAKAENESNAGSLAAKRTEIEDAMAKASDDLDMKEYHRLNLERSEIVRQIDRAESAEQSQRENAQAHERSEEAASIDRSVATYPAMNDQAHPLYNAVQMEIRRLGEVNPEFFKTPNWPEMVTAMQASKLGIAPANAQQQQQQVERPAAAQPPASIPRTGPVAQAPPPGRPGVQSARVRSAESQKEALEKAISESDDPEELMKFLRNNGTKLSDVE
jgi:hypothetical protein